MSQHPPDDRLISGAIIAAEMSFALDAVESAATYGRDAAPEPGCVAFRYRVEPLRDIALEGPVKALSGLTGVLRVNSQRERTERLGRFSREANGYSIWINLFEPELDRFIKLMASGLTPRTLMIEFDVEVAQWFDVGDYWDDVRYPRIDIHEYRIEWSVAPAGQGENLAGAKASEAKV